MRYFKKVYPSQPYILSSGKSFTFPSLPSGLGAHATENPVLIAEFELGIKKQIGGISEISAEEFDALKKKAPLKNLNEAISPSKVAQLKVEADRAAAERAARPTQLTPISRSFKAPNTRLNTPQFRPGIVDR